MKITIEENDSKSNISEVVSILKEKSIEFTLEYDIKTPIENEIEVLTEDDPDYKLAQDLYHSIQNNEIKMTSLDSFLESYKNK